MGSIRIIGAIVLATAGIALAPAHGSSAKLPCEADAVSAAETSPNLRQLDDQPWPGPDTSSGEIDIEGDTLVAFYRESLGSGILIYDISDPVAPALVSKIVTGLGTPYDVKITSDGKTAIVGYGTETASVVLGNAGVVAVDISNPAKPKITDDWISTRPGPTQNGHMVFTEKIAGEHWVFIAPNEGTGAWTLRLEGPAKKREFVYVGQTFPVEGGPLGPHDIFVQKDKVLGDWVLYAADGYHGWLAFDMSDPTQPLPIGGFTHASSGYTHSIQAGIVGEKRIVVTTEEVGVNIMKIYDATNLLTPFPIAYWYAEGVPVAAQHNFQIVGDYMYVAHYSGGMYVFDLSELAERSPTDFARIEPIGHYNAEGGQFWDVVVNKGLLYLTDYTTGGGLEVAQFGCVKPRDKKVTSTG